MSYPTSTTPSTDQTGLAQPASSLSSSINVRSHTSSEEEEDDIESVEEVEHSSSIRSSNIIGNNYNTRGRHTTSGKDHITLELKDHSDRINTMDSKIDSLITTISQYIHVIQNNTPVNNQHGSPNEDIFFGISTDSSSSPAITTNASAGDGKSHGTHPNSNMFSTPKTTVASASVIGRDHSDNKPPSSTTVHSAPTDLSFHVNQTLNSATTPSPTIVVNSSKGNLTGLHTATAVPGITHSGSMVVPLSTTISTAPSGHSYSSTTHVMDVSGTNKLHALSRLPLSGVQPEVFLEWRRELINNISQMPKYNGILTAPPAESWTLFHDNNVHLHLFTRERGYLETHQTISSYIQSAIPHGVESVVSKKMKDLPAEYHLPTILGFSAKGDYNAYSLLMLVQDLYIQRSNHRLQSIMTKLGSLFYNGQDHPNVFLTEYRDLNSQGMQLIPCWPEYKDEYLAHDIMRRLGRELDMVKTLIMNKGQDHPKSVAEIEEQLQLWWIKRMEKSTGSNGGTSSSSPSGGLHRGGRGGGYRGHNNQLAITHGNSGSTPTNSTNVVSTHTNATDRWKRTNNSAIHDHQKIDDMKAPTHTLGCLIITPADEDFDGQEEYALANNASRSSKESTAHFVPTPNDILFDTGASVSITGQKDFLKDMESADRIRISAFNGTTGTISDKKGTLRLAIEVNVKNVRYVPSCSYSLLSIGQICQNGYTALFTGDGAFIIPPNIFTMEDLIKVENNAILRARKVGNLYKRIISRKVQNELDEESKQGLDVQSARGRAQVADGNRKIPRKNDQRLVPSSSSSSSPSSSSALRSLVNANATTTLSISEFPSPLPPNNSESINDDDDY